MMLRPKVLTLRAGIILFFILLAGAWLRFYHLDHGLPDVLYVDAFRFVDPARQIASSGSLTPRDFQYPGAYLHLLALIYWIAGAQSVYATHLVAQVVAAVFGTALILVTWAAARQVCSRRGALLAAALVSVSTVFVTVSRIPATDCMLAVFMTAGMWMVARERATLRQGLAAGVFLGLAVGTKFTGLYLGIFMVVALGIAAVQSRKKRGEGSQRPGPLPGNAVALIALCGVVAFVVFVATTPLLIPRFWDYYDAFALQLKIQKYGQIGRVQGGFLDYLVSPTITWEQPWLGTSILYNDGPLVLIAGLAGCAIALSGRFGRAVLLHAIYVVLYMLLVCRPGHVKAMRYLVPILPSFYILTGWALERWLGDGKNAQCGMRNAEFRSGVPPSGGASKKKYLWALAVVLALAVPAWRSVGYVMQTRKETTNARALRWIRDNIPHDATLLVSPLFLDSLDQLPQNKLYLSAPGARQYRVPGNVNQNTELAPVYLPQMLDELRASGARYVVTNSCYDDAFSDVPENRRWFPRSTAAYKAYRERLRREGRLVHEEMGRQAGRIGPDIRIYKIAD